MSALATDYFPVLSSEVLAHVLFDELAGFYKFCSLLPCNGLLRPVKVISCTISGSSQVAAMLSDTNFPNLCTLTLSMTAI